MTRRYHLLDCLGRPVRPDGYKTFIGALRAAKRRHNQLWALYERHYNELPVRGVDGNKLMYTVQEIEL